MTNRTTSLLLATLIVGMWLPDYAGAQVIGTFRWRTEPFCDVLTLTVTQNSGVFTLDGFDEPCGGNPRFPVHGIAVSQPNGTITLGLSVIYLPGGLPVNFEATISPATISGNWRDSAGNSGALTFSPTTTSGDSRPGATPPPAISNAFSFSPNGAFAAVGGSVADPIPVSGFGTRVLWHAAKSAFRAGRAEGTEWDEGNVGFASAAFGFRTQASGRATFAAGFSAVAAGNEAVAMGFRAAATGAGSVALGSDVSASTSGTFMFGDRSTTTPLLTFEANQFLVRAAGGYGLYTNAALTAGVTMPAGESAWSSVSDANMKELFRDLDGDDVLLKIARMPIREWSYKAQDTTIRHVGPTAQDFHAAFGLGVDPLRISTIDADGIALRAIQALEARTREANEALSRENARLRERLDRIEQLLRERL